MSPSANLDAVSKATRQYERMSDRERRRFRDRNSSAVLKNGANAGMRFDEVPDSYIEYLLRPSTTVFRDEFRNLILWHLCEDD